MILVLGPTSRKGKHRKAIFQAIAETVPRQENVFKDMMPKHIAPKTGLLNFFTVRRRDPIALDLAGLIVVQGFPPMRCMATTTSCHGIH